MSAADERLERWGTVAIAVVFTLPLLLSRYYPGLDLPWHSVVVSMLARGDSEFFLGHLQVDPELSSYVLTYYALAAIARVAGDPVVATQIYIAIYVIAFVLGARRLLRAFGASGWLCALAAPAAYSFVMDFGFLPYATAYPLTLFLWAVLREIAVGEAIAGRAAAVAVLSAAIALTHPFGAALAVGGGVVVSTPILVRETARRGAVAVGAMLAASLPAVIAVLSIGDAPVAGAARFAEQMDLWDKLMFQDFTRIDESIGAIPTRLFGIVPELVCWLMFSAGLLVARLSPVLWGRTWRPRPALLLLFALAAAYLITPYSLFWPIYWYVVQPRVLPLLWVVLLAVAGGGTAERDSPAPGRRALIPVLGVAALALIAMTASMWPFASETRDFRAVVAASAPRARTLALIEQPRVRDRYPAGPFRHFGAYLVAERGGWVSHLVVGAHAAGFIVPVSRPADAPPKLAAPMPGRSRTFHFPTHGPGWDQFLIRDLDPKTPWDYFREHAPNVELVQKSGQWRLYRHKPH